MKDKKRSFSYSLSGGFRENRPVEKIDFRVEFFYGDFLVAHLKISKTDNFKKLKMLPTGWVPGWMPKNA